MNFLCDCIPCRINGWLLDSFVRPVWRGIWCDGMCEERTNSFLLGLSELMNRIIIV